MAEIDQAEGFSSSLPNGLDDEAVSSSVLPTQTGGDAGELQDYVLRVQKSLLASIDRQIETMESNIREKDHKIHSIQEVKTEMALMLYHTKTDLEKLSGQYSKVYVEAQQLYS
jgi:hypothetical protein